VSPDWESIFDPSEPYYSTESYASWAFPNRPNRRSVPFTDYDRALLAEMNINLETK